MTRCNKSFCDAVLLHVYSPSRPLCTQTQKNQTQNNLGMYEQTPMPVSDPCTQMPKRKANPRPDHRYAFVWKRRGKGRGIKERKNEKK
jgi:hypothetical protein